MNIIFQDPFQGGQYLFDTADGTDVIDDSVAPQFVGAVTASGITTSSVDINFTLNKDCTAYTVVVAQGSAVPTPAQIKAGVDYAGVTVLFNSSKSVTGNVADVFNVSGLTGLEGQQVTAYVTAEDSVPNLQDASMVRSVTVTLQSVNDLPTVLGNYPLQSLVVNQSFEFNASTNFNDTDALTYELSGIPGAAISQTSGIITWIPTSTGVYTGVVTATDTAGQSVSASLSINVVGTGTFWDFMPPSKNIIVFE